MPTLGRSITLLRETRELTQTEVAQAVGIGTPFLSLIERGSRKAKPDVLDRLAEVLQVPPQLLHELDARDRKPSRRKSQEAAPTDPTVSRVMRSLDQITAAERKLHRELHQLDDDDSAG